MRRNEIRACCSPQGLIEHREVRASIFIMSDNKRLAFSIIQFLHEQLRSGNLSSGAQESLEGGSTFPAAFNIVSTFTLFCSSAEKQEVFYYVFLKLKIIFFLMSI